MIGERIRRRAALRAEDESAGGGVRTGSGLSGVRTAAGISFAEYAVRFIISAALAGARVFGELSPFSVGLVAASSGPGAALASLIGGAIGYLIFGTLAWALKYIAAAVLVFTVVAVFRGAEIYDSEWFMPLAACVITACVGLVAVYDANWTSGAVALLVSDTVLAGGCAYFYRRALSPWTPGPGLERSGETVHMVSVMILLASLLVSLSGLKLFGVMSIGRAAAVLVVLLASYRGGVGIGCATGISLGLALDAASGGAPLFSAAYGFAGLVSGIFSKQSRLVFTISFILVDALAAVISIGSEGVPSILYEVFAASVVFMVLPATFMSRVSALLPEPRSGGGVMRAREYTKNRVEQASLAFRDLYETVIEKSGQERNDADVATIFDRAADATCRKCQRSTACWQTNYQLTVDVMNNLSPAMLERGKLQKSDFPAYFADECLHLPALVTAINAELRGLLYRRQYKNRLRDNQNAAFNQYSEISAILGGISAELGSGISFEPELEHRLSKYLSSIGVQAQTAVFRDRGRRLHAEVSGASVAAVKSGHEYLDRLSAVLGTRLCTSEDKLTPDKLILLEAEPLAASVGISCLKKEGQEMSGDKGAYFKTDEGVLYVILSDGMGSGEAAARYSGDAVRILERFLRSGVAPETAVRMLNDLMLLKNEDDTGCATIDLVSINLFTGETRMFKYGAAPSYLRQGGTVRRVRGKSLAAGLGIPPHDAPDQIVMELRPGNIAVIVSDGVTPGGEDGWLEDLLEDHNGKSPRELSRIIIDTAAKKFGKEDDMTVIAIFVTERG